MAEKSSIKGANDGSSSTQPPPIATTEIEQLRTERDLLLSRQRSIMELLGSTKPERILHDIRNVLNEQVLLRSLAGIEEDEGTRS